MAPVTFNNLAALKAINRLNTNTEQLRTSFERLSSGLRINRASDDSASLAIADKLRTDTRVYAQGVRNFNDGVSMLNIADGTLGELTSVITRIKELATQSANGAFSLSQRESLDTEANYLVLEFNRIVGSTKFNNLNILSGNQSATMIQGGYGIDGSISFTLGEDLQRKQGTGSFARQQDVSTTNIGTGEQFTGDFNGDGITDLIEAGTSPDTINLVLGNASGTFSKTQYTGLTGSLGTLTFGGVGDFDQDGKLDLIATSSDGTGILRGNGDGTFGSFQINSGMVGANTQSGVTDVNGDGKLDLLGYSGASVYLTLGNGDGTFQAGSAVARQAANIFSMGIGDFNGDGNVDVIMSNAADSNLYAFASNGAGSFTSIGSVRVDSTRSRLAVGDFDHDGYDDIASTALSSGQLYITKGSGGQGTSILETPASQTGVFLARIAVGDLNGDGYDDIHGTNLTNQYSYFNDGSGNFTTSVRSAAVVSSGQGKLGDFNGDGVLDVALHAANNLDIHLQDTQNVTTIGRFDLLSSQSSKDAMALADTILDRILKERGKIGSNMSRLNSGLANLRNIATNYAGAESRITNVDVAQESANNVRLATLQNTASAVLAQANLQSDIVLKLLQF